MPKFSTDGVVADKGKIGVDAEEAKHVSAPSLLCSVCCMHAAVRLIAYKSAPD